VEVIFFGEGATSGKDYTGGVAVNEEATTKFTGDLKSKL